MPTITEIVTEISPLAQVLASDGISIGALFGAPINPNLAYQIYLIRKPVEWRYDMEGIADGNTPSASLVQTVNYLYAWLGNYGLLAQALIATGGVIPNPSAPTTQYGLPTTATYTAVADGEYILPINLPSGAKVIFAQKGAALPINTSLYNYISPNLTLLGGLVMSADEDLTYQYVLPI